LTNSGRTAWSSHTEPLLTVVTVCLNRADKIGGALDSVVRQRAADVEHVVVDGVSTDGTLQVVARHAHVRLISESDKGLYDAMNKGLQLARGRYVLFLNSDDELADGVIDAVRPYLQAGYDAVCVGADFQRLVDDGTRLVIGCILAPDAIVLSPTTAALGSPLLNAKFLRREFLLEAVGLFDLRYRLASDVDLLLRAALTKPRVAVLPIVGHHYIEHDGSLTINPSGNNGREAAEECIAIADKTLARADLPRRVRFLMRAFRGGKTLAIADIDRRARAPRRRQPMFINASDIVRYCWYLVCRKLRSPEERFAAEIGTMRHSRPDVWLTRHVFRGK
jgi:glycosyltransferase involved in cell wall biosynthesis